MQEQVDVPDPDSCQHCFNDLANVSGASMQQIESETVLSKHLCGLWLFPLSSVLRQCSGIHKTG